MQRSSVKRARSGTGAGTAVRRRQLARPGDPLVLPDGEVLQPEGYEDQPDRFRVKPKAFKATKRRSIKELNADPGTLNGVACVMMYTLLGVSEREIADAMKTDVKTVAQIKKHPSYPSCFELVAGEFVSANSELIQARLAAYSHKALDGVFEIATDGRKENNRLKANIDLLNRAGHSPKDQAAKAGMNRQELRITVIEGETTIDVSHTLNGG